MSNEPKCVYTYVVWILTKKSCTTRVWYSDAHWIAPCHQPVTPEDDDDDAGANVLSPVIHFTPGHLSPRHDSCIYIAVAAAAWFTTPSILGKIHGPIPNTSQICCHNHKSPCNVIFPLPLSSTWCAVKHHHHHLYITNHTSYWFFMHLCLIRNDKSISGMLW